MHQIQASEEYSQDAYEIVLPKGSPSKVPLQCMKWCILALFVAVACVPVARRMLRPSLMSDDLIRIINLIDVPLSQLLFRPFNEHVAPGIEVVSWITWQAIGQDIRLAPLGFCIASAVPWILLLGIVAFWLGRETCSPTATLVSLALIAQSCLALEIVCWYSASTFTWAILGVMLGVLGSGTMPTQPRIGLALTAAGSFLAPSFSLLGVLAAPLAVLTVVLNGSTTSRQKIRVLATATSALGAYLVICYFAGSGAVQVIARANNGGMRPLLAIRYALEAAGQILWPSLLVRPSILLRMVPEAVAVVMGAVALAATAGLAWRTQFPNRRKLVLVGAAMIYMGYALVYAGRAGFVERGDWDRSELLYFEGSRYHTLPLFGMGAVLAAVLASNSWIRKLDRFALLPALFGTGVGLLALFINRPETQIPVFQRMLVSPDQIPTLKALHHVGELAKNDGITRDQLKHLISPVVRNWLFGRPFEISALINQAPQTVLAPMPDAEALNHLMTHLSLEEQLSIQIGACVSLNPPEPDANAHYVATSSLVKIQGLSEISPGHYQRQEWPAFLEYTLDTTSNCRFLALSNLASDHNLQISWTTEPGKWSPGQKICWIGSKNPENSDAPALIDLRRLVNWPASPVTRIRITFTHNRQIARILEPQLLR